VQDAHDRILEEREMSATVVSYIRIIALRDLRDVAHEIEAYPDDELLWKSIDGTTNPGGNLALHLAGNMRHYVGAVLGGSSYVRDRSSEFADRGLSRAEVLGRINDALTEVDAALSELDDGDLQKPFPENLGDFQLFTGQFLTHLLAHMGYHLGQLDYHRRIVTGENKPLGAQSIPELEAIPY
jgi:uncharacterized damage-inducible protein DinB